MKKPMTCAILVLIFAPAVWAADLASYPPCQQLYTHSFPVVLLEDAARYGPCVKDSAVYVPSLDPRTGVTTMRIRTRIDLAMNEFGREMEKFRRISPEGRERVNEAMAQARPWMGGPRAEAMPGYYNEPPRFYRDQYNRPVPYNAFREEWAYAFVGVPARAGGQGGYGMRMGGVDLMNSAKNDLVNLPVIGIIPFVVKGSVGLATSIVGGAVEIPAHVLGHTIPETARAVLYPRYAQDSYYYRDRYYGR